MLKIFKPFQCSRIHKLLLRNVLYYQLYWLALKSLLKKIIPSYWPKWQFSTRNYCRSRCDSYLSLSFLPTRWKIKCLFVLFSVDLISSSQYMSGFKERRNPRNTSSFMTRSDSRLTNSRILWMPSVTWIHWMNRGSKLQLDSMPLCCTAALETWYRKSEPELYVFKFPLSA